MGFNKALDPLTHGVWELLVALWPLWLLFLLPIVVRLVINLYHQRRLAQSGIFEIDKMEGLMFEQYLEVLFRNLGYKAQRTQASGDFGADLIISKAGTRTIVQAKRYTKNVGVKAIQEVVAAQKMYNGTNALVVTNSSYTKQAQQLARANNVELWDRAHLVSAMLSIQKQARKGTTSAKREIPETKQ